MSKLIDITDKLNFEEKPSVRVKNVDLAINNDAVSMLKVAALFEDGNGKICTILTSLSANLPKLQQAI